MDKGLTLFAPTDDAFHAKGLPDLTKLTAADLVTLLDYHALPQYAPKAAASLIGLLSANCSFLACNWPNDLLLGSRGGANDMLLMGSAKEKQPAILEKEPELARDAGKKGGGVGRARPCRQGAAGAGKVRCWAGGEDE
ncbi:hypothetical protein ACQ4PT_025436 [Festuca glaucescens]